MASCLAPRARCRGPACGQSAIGRVGQQGHDAHRGKQLVQQFQPLGRYLQRQLLQVPIKIVARQWMYPLSLHCRNAISSMRFVTRPCLQISQMTGSSSTAISDPLAVVPNPSQACTTFFEGCVSYFTLRRELTRL